MVFGPLIELVDAGGGPDVAGLVLFPDGAGLAVEVFAAQADFGGDGGVGATAVGGHSVGGSSVGTPTLGVRAPLFGSGAMVSEVCQPACVSLIFPEGLEGVGLAHELTERFASMFVVFEDRLIAGWAGRDGAD